MAVDMDLMKTGWLDIIAKQVAILQKPTSGFVHEVIVIQGTRVHHLSQIIPFRQEVLWIHLNKENIMRHNCSFQTDIYVHTECFGYRQTPRTDLSWESERNFSKNRSDFPIALPGDIKSVSLRGRSKGTSKLFTIYWLHEQYELKHRRIGGSCCSACTPHKHLSHCVRFPLEVHFETNYVQTYLLFRRKAAARQCLRGRRPSSSPQIKWTYAAALCHEYEGHLPLLRSKSEMHFFIAFLKVSESVPQFDALFIGLHAKPGEKVSKQCLSLPYEKTSDTSEGRVMLDSHLL